MRANNPSLPAEGTVELGQDETEMDHKGEECQTGITTHNRVIVV